MAASVAFSLILCNALLTSLYPLSIFSSSRCRNWGQDIRDIHHLSNCTVSMALTFPIVCRRHTLHVASFDYTRYSSP